MVATSVRGSYLMKIFEYYYSFFFVLLLQKAEEIVDHITILSCAPYVFFYFSPQIMFEMFIAVRTHYVCDVQAPMSSLPATGKRKDCEQWWENTHNPRASSWVLGWTRKNRWCIGRAVQIVCQIKRLCLIGDSFWANKRSLSGRKVKGLAYLAQLPLPSHTERSDYWISRSNLNLTAMMVLSWQFEVFL